MNTREGIYIMSLDRGIVRFNKDEKYFQDLLGSNLHVAKRVGYTMPAGSIRGSKDLLIPCLTLETHWVDAVIVSSEMANFCFYLFDKEPIS